MKKTLLLLAIIAFSTTKIVGAQKLLPLSDKEQAQVEKVADSMIVEIWSKGEYVREKMLKRLDTAIDRSSYNARKVSVLTALKDQIEGQVAIIKEGHEEAGEKTLYLDYVSYNRDHPEIDFPYFNMGREKRKFEVDPLATVTIWTLPEQGEVPRAISTYLQKRDDYTLLWQKMLFDDWLQFGCTRDTEEQFSDKCDKFLTYYRFYFEDGKIKHIDEIYFTQEEILIRNVL